MTKSKRNEARKLAESLVDNIINESIKKEIADNSNEAFKVTHEPEQNKATGKLVNDYVKKITISQKELEKAKSYQKTINEKKLNILKKKTFPIDIWTNRISDENSQDSSKKTKNIPSDLTSINPDKAILVQDLIDEANIIHDSKKKKDLNEFLEKYNTPITSTNKVFEKPLYVIPDESNLNFSKVMKKPRKLKTKLRKIEIALRQNVNKQEKLRKAFSDIKDFKKFTSLIDEIQSYNNQLKKLREQKKLQQKQLAVLVNDKISKVSNKKQQLSTNLCLKLCKFVDKFDSLRRNMTAASRAILLDEFNKVIQCEQSDLSRINLKVNKRKSSFIYKLHSQ